MQGQGQGEKERQPEQTSHFLEEEDSIVLDNEEGTSAIIYRRLAGTIRADITSNRRFLSRQTRITFSLILIIMFLKLLPSPLIITKVQNDPSDFSREACPE